MSGYNGNPTDWTAHFAILLKYYSRSESDEYGGIHSSSRIRVLAAIWIFILVERTGSIQVQLFMYFPSNIYILNFSQLEQN